LGGSYIIDSFGTLLLFAYFTVMDIWKLLSGIVIFLMGSSFMEGALQQVTGRQFKLFLKRQTSHRLKAVLGGTLLTVFMQSSSVVNLLVLSLVGAGVVEMYQALAVMMGANLGTTFTGWIMATLGFNFDIKDFALPWLAIAGLLMVLNEKEKKIHQIARFFTGFAFLFLGLSYIKESMEQAVMQTSLAQFAGYPLFFFSLLGLLLTALVQSSSVTMALVLSVLYHKGIDVHTAAAIILGAEVGTTLKLGLASMHGLAVKKRVALGNITFNTLSSFVLFFCIDPLLKFLSIIPGLSDPLIQVVAFQSLTNVVGIILFLPFLKPLAKVLSRYFKEETSMEFIHKVSIDNIPMAVEAVEKESLHLFAHTLYYMRSLFVFNGNSSEYKLYPYQQLSSDIIRYEHVKALYGEVHGYSVKIRQQEMTKEEYARMESVLTAMRNLMYAAKSLRDIEKDIRQLSRSSNETKYQFYINICSQSEMFYEEAIQILNSTREDQVFNLLKSLQTSLQQTYNEGLLSLYEDNRAKSVNALELATLVNVHREMITAFKSIFFAMKERFLKGEEAALFEDMPGFIH
jgi:phosphate:Na+ symporter